MQARDVHFSCVACVHWPACTRQNCVQQCVHTAVFVVLHALNVQAHACVKFKLSCTVSKVMTALFVSFYDAINIFVRSYQLRMYIRIDTCMLITVCVKVLVCAYVRSTKILKFSMVIFSILTALKLHCNYNVTNAHQSHFLGKACELYVEMCKIGC